MTEPITCKICHKYPPREGLSIYGVCMGQEKNPMDASIDTSMDQTPLVSIEPKEGVEPVLAICSTCGNNIEPYQLGRNTIHRGICHPCMMKKKYGADWVPGGNGQAKNARIKAKRDAKKAAGNGNSKNTTTPSDTGPPEVHAEHVAMLDSIKADQQEQAIMAKTVSGALTIKGIKHLTIAFISDDEAMYERLRALATKERRTMEQQVLYFLDQVIEV